MKINFTKFLYPLGAFLWAMLLLSMAFGDVILRPNAFVTEAGGDGLKNHFSYVHYIKNDKGFHFTGMNYPYGEHIFYPDQQPLLSGFLSFVHRNVTPVLDSSIGIANVLMLFSVGFCAIFLFLILQKFNLPAWYSLIAAGLIAALSPQIYRFVAHQALGYTVVVPMLWFMLMQFEDHRRKWLWGIAIVTTILVFGGLHLYYLPLGVFFILAYAFIVFLVNIQRLNTVKWTLLGMFVMAILPIIIIQIIISATDPSMASRIQTPWGFFVYVASFQSIFYPNFTPFHDVLDYYFKVSKIQFEGYGSVGIIGLFTLIFLVIRSFRFLIHRNFKRIIRFTSTPRLNHYLWAASLLLLFSMGIPFVWGLEWLLDIIPKIKQFRSVGRFNWAFFYVFMVFTSLYIFLIYKRLRQKKLYSFAFFFLGLVFVLWFANDYAYLKHVRTYNKNGFISNTLNKPIFPYMDSLKAAGFDANDYQALVGFPFYHSGTEKVGIMRSTLTFDYVAIQAYNIGLPMLNSYIARGNIDEGTQVAQLFGDTILPKPVRQDFHNDKPLLAIVYEDPNQPLFPVEQHLINQSEHITSLGNFHFYKMPISVFEHDNSAKIQRLNNMDSLYAYNWEGHNFAVSDSSMSFFHYNSFEDGNSEIAFMGKKGIGIDDKSELELYNGKIDLDSGEVLMVSVWVEIDYREATANLYHQVLDENGKIIGLGYTYPSQILDYHSGWLRLAYELKAEPHVYTHRILLNNPKVIVADDLLMYPKGAEVFLKRQDGKLMFNNFPLE